MDPEPDLQPYLNPRGPDPAHHTPTACMKPPSVSRALFPPLSRFKLHAHCTGPDNCPTRSRQEPRTTELAQAQRRRDIILGPGDLPEDRTTENLVMHTRMSARGGGVSMVKEDKEPTRVSVQADALGRRLSPKSRISSERGQARVMLAPVHTLSVKSALVLRSQIKG